MFKQRGPDIGEPTDNYTGLVVVPCYRGLCFVDVEDEISVPESKADAIVGERQSKQGAVETSNGLQWVCTEKGSRGRMEIHQPGPGRGLRL